ncbi:hypothetical protein ISN44_As13g003890 [Arabidopsis suecica]|uniref:Uncharacterized protein n=1 Tax=Arabidopsis suecica TaxID=45249 RepID=A0A8T1XP35_ARASU|nr:hypothetical protein ISN44_As13g003890 [Arabidopsis suecica]
MENKTFSSNSINLLVVFLLLCTFLSRTESARPSHHELLSITGRTMMSNYKINSAIGTPSSTSNHAPGGNESALPSHQELLITGRRMMSYYKPNSDIGTPSSTSDRGGGGNGRRLMSQMDVGASSSGQGGGRNRH